jgi:hypothetical protein
MSQPPTEELDEIVDAQAGLAEDALERLGLDDRAGVERYGHATSDGQMLQPDVTPTLPGHLPAGPLESS